MDDFSIDDSGLYIAKRSFLLKRGFCCGNKCVNCPYINWNNDSNWVLPRKESLLPTAITSKHRGYIQTYQTFHKTQMHIHSDSPEDLIYHLKMYTHYTYLLAIWKSNTK